MSRFVALAGLAATTVPGRADKLPLAPIANPEIVDDPALETYTKRPSGVTAFQQFADPNVGTRLLIGSSVPPEATAYEDTADPLGTLAGPVSETIATPSGAKETENAPRPMLGLTTIGDSVPSPRILNTSMLFVRCSGTDTTKEAERA